jgi:molecular chaperone DnaK
MRDEAKANEEIDRKEREKVDKLNTADTLIFSTEKQLKEYGSKIPADKITVIEKALADLKQAHADKNIPAIDNAMNQLNAAWQAASEEMYKATSGQQQETDQQQQNPGNQQGSAGSSKDDEVTDVDFEEVKDK